MNYKIKEFAIKSGATVIQDGVWGTDFNFDKFDLELFSKLMIKECSNLCITDNVSNLDMEVMRNSGKFTVQDLATKSCGENLSIKLKKHFQIKE